MLRDVDEHVKAFNAFREARTPALQRVFGIVSRMAQSSQPILIFGETGTGKEVVARAIHELSATQEDRRSGRNRPFVPVNCAAIPHELVESEVFGHVKGAFTGAAANRAGFFEQAHGGTLFLDEIGEFPLKDQAKLLRVLDTGEVTPVGGKGAQRYNARIIAATNRDLTHEVAEGRFRQDLFQRIAGAKVVLPPLRERHPDDILSIARYYVREKAPSGMQRWLSPDAEQLITSYAWPGNVRELEQKIAFAILMSDGEEIRPEDFDIPSSEPEKDSPDMAQIAEDRITFIATLIQLTMDEVRAKGKDGERQKGVIYLRALDIALRLCGNDSKRAARLFGVETDEFTEELKNLARYRSSMRPLARLPEACSFDRVIL